MSQPSLPSVQAYLARLPEGVDSYPQCMIKAAPLVDQLAMKPLPDALLGELPERVVELVRNPPMVSAWIPEVVAMTYSISIRDCFFPPGVGDVAYEAWAYERNRRMLSTRLYRALFLLVSPDRLFKQIGPRWSRMRRGSELEVLEHRAGFVRLQTRYPPYLHDDSVALGMKGAFRAVAELAGAKDVRAERPKVSETTTEFTIRFTT